MVALSGGERRRLALALVVASGANFLLLDEPTNHLDLESREALEAALEAFPGTVLLVSHDRGVLDAVAERIVAVENGTLRSYPGGWADYARIRAGEDAPRRPRRRAQGEAAREAEAAQPSARARRGLDPGARLELADLERRLAEGATSTCSRRGGRASSRACWPAGRSSSSPRSGCDESPSGGVGTVCRR